MLDAQDEPREILALGAVQAGRRLVEQQQRRLERQRPGKTDELLDAERQRADRGGAMGIKPQKLSTFSTASRWRNSSSRTEGK